jgi:hypothetical protein
MPNGETTTLTIVCDVSRLKVPFAIVARAVLKLIGRRYGLVCKAVSWR